MKGTCVAYQREGTWTKERNIDKERKAGKERNMWEGKESRKGREHVQPVKGKESNICSLSEERNMGRGKEHGQRKGM